MRIHFRPLLGLSIACAILFAFLNSLGVWQVQRLHWKLGLIAQVNQNLAAKPLTLGAALKMGPDGAQYHRVALDGRFDNAKESYVFTTDANGDAVFHVVTPFETGAGVFLVDRGLVPPALKDPSTRRAGQIEGDTRVVGVWRIPDPPGFFTPPPDRAARVWYSRNIGGMAAASGVKLVEPVIVEADAAPNPGGWPKGGQTVVTFRNEHLQYAITWFALAAGLLGVYLAYHVSRGRLGLVAGKETGKGAQP
jgi:surfeit locus 1 family protein